jgi:hypothetical protein
VSEVSLYVTPDALAHIASAPANQLQIAYRDGSVDIARPLRAASAANKLTLKLGGFVTLVVGDTGAIWRSHNKEYADDFDALFKLLAHHPGQPMRFLCTLE